MTFYNNPKIVVMVLNTKVQGNWWDGTGDTWGIPNPYRLDSLVNVTRFYTYPHCPYRDTISYDAP